MKILAELPGKITNLLYEYQNGNPITGFQSCIPQSRSLVYKIDQYCFKQYTSKGSKDGVAELKALLALNKGFKCCV